jgi:hypothetical protein
VPGTVEAGGRVGEGAKCRRVGGTARRVPTRSPSPSTLRVSTPPAKRESFTCGISDWEPARQSAGRCGCSSALCRRSHGTGRTAQPDRARSGQRCGRRADRRACIQQHAVPPHQDTDNPRQIDRLRGGAGAAMHSGDRDGPAAKRGLRCRCLAAQERRERACV